MRKNNIKIVLSQIAGWCDYFSDGYPTLCRDFVKKKLGKEPLMVSLSLSTKDDGGEAFEFSCGDNSGGMLVYWDKGEARYMYKGLRDIIFATFQPLPDEVFKLFVKVEELA